MQVMMFSEDNDSQFVIQATPIEDDAYLKIEGESKSPNARSSAYITG